MLSESGRDAIYSRQRQRGINVWPNACPRLESLVFWSRFVLVEARRAILAAPSRRAAYFLALVITKSMNLERREPFAPENDGLDVQRARRREGSETRCALIVDASAR